MHRPVVRSNHKSHIRSKGLNPQAISAPSSLPAPSSLVTSHEWMEQKELQTTSTLNLSFASISHHTPLQNAQLRPLASLHWEKIHAVRSGP